MENPEWLDNNKFAKISVTIFRWHSKSEEVVDEALFFKLFGSNGTDFKNGVDDQLSYIKNKESLLVVRVVKGLIGSEGKVKEGSHRVLGRGTWKKERRCALGGGRERGWI